MGKENEEENKNIFDLVFPHDKGVKLLDFKEIIWDKERGRASQIYMLFMLGFFAHLQ